MANYHENQLDTIEVSLPEVEEITLIDGQVAELTFPEEPAVNIEVEWLEPEVIIA